MKVTQPALSMRIKQLEEETGQQLLVRSKGGMALTPAGERLIEYIRLREIVDTEVQRSLSGTDVGRDISGLIRIAGHFSAIMHVALPSLAKLLTKNASLQVETIVREHHETSLLLERGQCDLAFVMEPLQGDSYETYFLGYEKYILTKSKQSSARSRTFLDSHPLDRTTEEFFKAQSSSRKITSYHRSFLHNEVGILRGVELGLGVAVVAAREASRSQRITKVAGYRPLFMPCFLQASRHAKRSRMLSAAIHALRMESGGYLEDAPDKTSASSCAKPSRSEKVEVG